MSQYVDITLDEMKEVLRPEERWACIGEGQREYYFEKRFLPPRPDLVIQVWSSISTATKGSRSCGSDCIRINGLRNKKAGSWQPLSKSISVYRVIGWKNNLLKAIDEMKHIVWDRRDWEPKR